MGDEWVFWKCNKRNNLYSWWPKPRGTSGTGTRHNSFIFQRMNGVKKWIAKLSSLGSKNKEFGIFTRIICFSTKPQIWKVARRAKSVLKDNEVNLGIFLQLWSWKTNFYCHPYHSYRKSELGEQANLQVHQRLWDLGTPLLSGLVGSCVYLGPLILRWHNPICTPSTSVPLFCLYFQDTHCIPWYIPTCDSWVF